MPDEIDQLRARYRQILENPELLNFALVVDNGFGTGLAIPTGGARESGHLEFRDRRLANQFIEQVTGHAGFPNPRCTTINGQENSVEWGEPIVWHTDPHDHVRIGAQFGYKQEVLAEAKAWSRTRI